MRKMSDMIFGSVEGLKEALEMEGYDILNESYSTLDIIDAYESDGKVTEIEFAVLGAGRVKIIGQKEV